MVFSSTVFLFAFLPVVLLVYYVTPAKLRNLCLLVTSLFFYAWGESWFVLVMLASIAVDFLAGLMIAGALGGPWKADVVQLVPGGERTVVQRLGLLFSLSANLGILVFFKYFDFSVEGYNTALGVVGLHDLQWQTTMRVALPLGISFFTFQSMSYTFDVYFGRVRATRSLLDFATFVSLFPQLVAGPIVRYRDVAERLTSRRVTVHDFAYGVQRFIVGLSKKVIVANAFSVPADKIFALQTADLTPGLAWLAVVCYAFQIYFDFSGYSDMAIGLGRMFGFRFLENFNYPYISRSITEFWRRWHISLSSWFRDYVYIPAGGSRKGRARTFTNLWLVFFLCGLWHGASWNFVVWGLFHGGLLVAERIVRERSFLNLRVWGPLRHVYVLLSVLVGWVIFRAESMSQVWGFLGAMIGVSRGDGLNSYPALYLDKEMWVIFGVAIVGACPLVPFLRAKFEHMTEEAPNALLPRLLGPAGAVVLVGLMVVSAMKLASNTHNPFIYFRF